MEWEEVLRRLNTASQMFLERDRLLLELNVNERSMTHKFASYLQEQFPEYHVDCEYNRRGNMPKELILDSERLVRQDDDRGGTVFPDVIVHRRDTNDNLLVIEAKKSGGSAVRDRTKLRAFTQDAAYRYEHAVLMLFNTRPPFDIRISEFIDE